MVSGSFFNNAEGAVLIEGPINYTRKQRREAALKVCDLADNAEEARTVLEKLGLLEEQPQ